MIYAQTILTIFIFFALSRAFLRFRESKLTRNAFLSWTILWLIVILVVWRPSVTTEVAKILGIGRGADLLIYLSIITLFYLVFRIYVKLEDLERQITQIIKIIALSKPSRKKNKRK